MLWLPVAFLFITIPQVLNIFQYIENKL